ncbi:MAG: hypothetical protein ACI9SE_000574 [Neolewinella sp.]|jgi:hypothetical protein
MVKKVRCQKPATMVPAIYIAATIAHTVAGVFILSAGCMHVICDVPLEDPLHYEKGPARGWPWCMECSAWRGPHQHRS